MTFFVLKNNQHDMNHESCCQNGSYYMISTKLVSILTCLISFRHIVCQDETRLCAEEWDRNQEDRWARYCRHAKLNGIMNWRIVPPTPVLISYRMLRFLRQLNTAILINIHSFRVFSFLCSFSSRSLSTAVGIVYSY